MSEIEKLEERLAHATRLAEDLSDIVAAQADRIDKLETQMRALIDFARSAAEADGAVTLTDVPPHY